MRLPPLFMVVATQNPVEFEGTYPLPEAQLDRFLFKLDVGYASAGAEREIVLLHHRGFRTGDLSGGGDRAPCWTRPSLLDVRRQVGAVRLDDDLATYMVEIERATRSAPEVAVRVERAGGDRDDARRARPWPRSPAGSTSPRTTSRPRPRPSCATASCSRPEAELDGVTPDDVVAAHPGQRPRAPLACRARGALAGVRGRKDPDFSAADAAPLLLLLLAAPAGALAGAPPRGGRAAGAGAAGGGGGGLAPGGGRGPGGGAGGRWRTSSPSGPGIRCAWCCATARGAPCAWTCGTCTRPRWRVRLERSRAGRRGRRWPCPGGSPGPWRRARRRPSPTASGPASGATSPSAGSTSGPRGRWGSCAGRTPSPDGAPGCASTPICARCSASSCWPAGGPSWRRGSGPAGCPAPARSSSACESTSRTTSTAGSTGRPPPGGGA